MATDPYRYFRIEAQELIESLAEGFLALEKKPSDFELMRRLLREAHTFKGASRVVKRSDIGDRAHRIEDILSSHHKAEELVPAESLDRALGLLDEIKRLVAALGSEQEADSQISATPDEAPPPPMEREEQQTVRVAVSQLDALLESASEAHIAVAALRNMNEQLPRIRTSRRSLVGAAGLSDHQTTLFNDLLGDLDQVYRSLGRQIDQALGEIDNTKNTASELRLVPAQSLMSDLERVVRDGAREADKQVEFRVTGARTDIDAHVLAGLRTALVHIVRNSVAHGIELPSERRKAGKVAKGRVDIVIERRGHRVAILCRDDGQGLDLDAVRRVAVARGLASAETAEAMDESALGQLLLRGGVSTSRSLTGLSGRGLGLEAVRHAVEALKGEIKIRSRAGQGTEVEVFVPLTLASVPTLSMQVDGDTVLLPLDSVKRTLRLSSEDISQNGDTEQVVIEGRVVPFLPLRRALKGATSSSTSKQSAVVIEAEGCFAALGVDGIGAARIVIVRNIPEHADVDPIVSGVALDEYGAPQAVLAPPALLHAVSALTPSPGEPIVPARAPILVIDDSLTTRTLEQSILESAGYEVDLAVSGEDALQKAREKSYGLFIVDVEMPGMSGFEFIARARSNPELRETPSILVTSREDPEDKRRGKDVGARAYIVKSEFDQAELLEGIRRLVG